MRVITENSPKRTLCNVTVGEGVQFYDFVNAYGCMIGSGTKVGAFVEIQKGVVIGENCKISSHTFICEGVSIGSSVFIGHNVSFINDRYPHAVNEDGSLQQENDWTVISTTVKDGASIGTGAVILCGITVGECAMIGAGAVVTADVPPGAVAVGNPARILCNVQQQKGEKR